MRRLINRFSGMCLRRHSSSASNLRKASLLPFAVLFLPLFLFSAILLPPPEPSAVENAEHSFLAAENPEDFLQSPCRNILDFNTVPRFNMARVVQRIPLNPNHFPGSKVHAFFLKECFRILPPEENRFAILRRKPQSTPLHFQSILKSVLPVRAGPCV